MKMNKKFLIIDSRPYGLFSIFLHTIDNIKWAEDNNYIPVVRWGAGRRDVNLHRPGAAKASEFADPAHVGTEPNFSTNATKAELDKCLYSDSDQSEDEGYSCWEHFFEPVTNHTIKEALGSEHEISDIFQVGFHDLDLASLSDKFLIYNLHSYTPLNLWVHCYNNSPSLQEHREKVGLYIKKFVKVKEEIAKKVDTFTKERFSENTIGVHIRGTDKSSESYIGQRPHITVDDYITGTERALKESPDATLFVASDNNEAIAKMFKSFPKNKIVVYNCTRMSSYSSYLPVHLSSAVSPLLGEEALIDCLLLSKCKHIVCTDSNLAATALYFNPEAEMTFININLKRT